jgi:alkylation response protein AidB-like acyl-CoA dehydrogenase
MDFAFNEEQEFLRETARRFLDDKAPSEVVRRVMDSEAGYDAGLWAEIAAQGWQAMAIPEEYGGAGYSFLEQVVLLEEMGRSVFPSPYLGGVVMAANLILRVGTEAQKAAYLPGIASGEHIWSVAITEASGRWDRDGVRLSATADGDGFSLRGTKRFVLDGHVADRFVVVAEDGTGEIALFVVEAGAEGVRSDKLDTMDQTRSLADVHFDDVKVPADARLEGAWADLEHVLDLAAVALAAEQVGGAQACLHMAVEYAKVRTQFGRPIGSFQAVKHKCADMLVQVESARSAAYYAAWVASENSDELTLVAPLSKSYCSEAFFFCAAENIQIHGGIGFTWEHDAHLYFKRAKSSEILLGDPAYHRSRLADRLGI